MGKKGVGLRKVMFVLPLLISLVPCASQTPTTIEVRDTVLRSDVTRFGVNLGHSTNWEAATLNANVIDNPGFEPGHYGMVSHARTGTTGDLWIQDHWQVTWNNDQYDIGQPAGFWTGAEWEIVTGPSKGRSGIVLDHAHVNDRNEFTLDSTGPTPNAGDIIFLRNPIHVLPDDGALAEVEVGDARPGSPGVQSLRLSKNPLELWRASRTWYLDTVWSTGDRTAGKLQLADGTWNFSVWAKGTQVGDELDIKFQRQNEGTFFQETFPLTTGWQLIERTYQVAPGSDDDRTYTDLENHPLLVFTVSAGDVGQEVLIDDLVLERAHTNAYGFNDEVVEALEELQPGVIRTWAGYFGYTLGHAVESPFAHGYSGFSPNDRVPSLWNYRLHDFLGLCEIVGAEPWYVIPPTFSQADLNGLMEYLGGPADGFHPWADLRAAQGHPEPWTSSFDTIHLEYSNEGWGGGTNIDPFFGASLSGGTNLGMVGSDRLGVLKASPHYQSSDFEMIIGGQHTFPYRQSHIETASTEHDALGVGPYFLRVLDNFATDEDIFHRLFATPAAEVVPGGKLHTSIDLLDGFGNGTKLHTYEISFHLNRQDAGNPAPAELRNDVLTGQGGAMVLPLAMLTYLRDLGMEVQCAFQFAGFSSEADDGEDLRMWGLVRDVLRTGRKRPTFLGVALANMAIRGDMIETVQSGADPTVAVTPGNWLADNVDLHLVQSFAFRQGTRRTLILFNCDLVNTQPVIINTSSPVIGRSQGGGLAPGSIFADNEDQEDVELEFRGLPNFQSGTRIGLPPASMVVLSWRQ